MVVQENYGFSGGGIYIKNSSFPVLQNVTIENNDAKYGDGGGIYLNRKSCATIDNSSVKNNTALYGGGGIFFTDGSSALMTGVFIGANKAKTGAGLYCYNHCYPVILNCSIGGNIASQSGGGIFCGFSGGLEVANSILWGDTPEEVYMSTAMEANFIAAAFTDIQGGESAIKTNGNGSVFWLGGNLDSDPRFFDPGQGDLRIGPKSPCIDAGIQDTFFVYGTSDTILIPQRKFFETKPDIGAFESNYSEVDGEDSRVTTPESALKWQLSNFPNPFNPLTQVSFVLPQDCSVSIKIYDLSGSLVSTLINRELKSGFHTVVWNGKNYNGESVASGVYMCIMNAVTHSERMKIVLIK
jgi:hypothetical protein